MAGVNVFFSNQLCRLEVDRSPTSATLQLTPVLLNHKAAPGSSTPSLDPSSQPVYGCSTHRLHVQPRRAPTTVREKQTCQKVPSLPSICQASGCERVARERCLAHDGSRVQPLLVDHHQLPISTPRRKGCRESRSCQRIQGLSAKARSLPRNSYATMGRSSASNRARPRTATYRYVREDSSPASFRCRVGRPSQRDSEHRRCRRTYHPLLYELQSKSYVVVSLLLPTIRVTWCSVGHGCIIRMGVPNVLNQSWIAEPLFETREEALRAASLSAVYSGDVDFGATQDVVVDAELTNEPVA